MGWLNPATGQPGEKAAANFDEDSLSMAANAGVDCLTGVDRQEIDGLYFATTTSPYRERQCAVVIATALNLRPDVRTADFTDAIKSGGTAVLAACDSVKAGSAKYVTVCAADCRLGKPGSSQEQTYGDGAAALTIGEKGVIASLEGSYSTSYDFMDHWRADTDKYTRVWEERWIRDEGYGRFIGEAISVLMNKHSLSPGDIAKVIYPCLFVRSHADIGKKLGFEPEQIQEHMFTTIGNTGVSYPLMMLVAALEDAKPGDKILVASYGNGVDAMLFQVTEDITKIGPRNGIKKSLAVKKYIDSYEKYATCHEVLTIDTAGRGDETSSTPVSGLWRSRKAITGLVGSKCKRCGTPQYPPQRVCAKPDCGAVDEMEEYTFADKKGRLFTYTADSLAFSPSPPLLYGAVDFEGGGRSMFEISDCELDMLSVGMPVEMTFRRKYHDEMRGISGYTWKAKPANV